MFFFSALDVYFTEDEFRASEPELKIPVSIGKSKRTASPLILKLLPHSITDIISDGNITQPVCPNMCSCVCEIGTSFFGKLYVVPMTLYCIQCVL